MVVESFELGEIEGTVLFEVIQAGGEVSLYYCLSHLFHAVYEELLVFATLGS